MAVTMEESNAQTSYEDINILDDWNSLSAIDYNEQNLDRETR